MTPDLTSEQLTSVPTRVLHARVRNFRGQTFVAVGQEILELTDTAIVIWRSIDGTRTVAEIAETVVDEYDIDKPTAIADVSALVSTLARAGLVRFSTTQPAT